MTIIKIITFMFLSMGTGIRFVEELVNFDGTWHDIAELILAGVEVVALGYLFSLIG